VAKLDGWKRIGIVASIAWIVGAGAYTYNSESDRASDFIAEAHVRCDSDLQAWKDEQAREAAFQRCNKEAEDSLASAIDNARLEAVLVALVPVPLGWGFAYLVFFLVRWVKRGFAPPAERG